MFFKRIKQEREESRVAGASENRQTEQTPWKYIICGSEDYIIVKCPKSPKYNEKRRKQEHFNEKGNCAYANGKKNSNQKIYASMTRMYVIDECPSGNFGDSLQLTNWI